MTKPKEIEFAQDTEQRRKWFRAASFSHPAKMVLGLQIYLIEHYTKVGETILDPMAGSGTVLVGCALGRNVVCVELEQKFIKMIEANWEKIKSLGPMLGYKMGEATILQGEARQLDKLPVDKCVFSPPFADSEHNYKHGLKALGKNFKGRKAWETKGKVDKIVTSPPYSNEHSSGLSEKTIKEAEKIHKRKYTRHSFTGGEDYGSSKNNIGNLPYGEISAVISSPPFGEAHEKNIGGVADKNRADLKDYSYLKTGTKGQIGDMPYADAVITSPPYEKINTTGKANSYPGSHGPHSQVQIQDYRESNNNIGNLKSENYLEAMLAVYRQCHKVLKDGGLLCLVVKNFIRDKKLVRLDLDTIKLCEKAGFVLKERLKRKLTHKSFWRILYERKFPDAPKIEFEDVLIFAKARPDGTGAICVQSGESYLSKP